MINSVTPDQFKEIMSKVQKDHRLIIGHCVKYVNTSFDFRDNTFWRLEFKCFFDTKVFTSSNRGHFVDEEYEEESGSLFNEIVAWLDEGKTLSKEEVDNE